MSMHGCDSSSMDDAPACTNFAGLSPATHHSNVNTHQCGTMGSMTDKDGLASDSSLATNADDAGMDVVEEERTAAVT